MNLSTAETLARLPNRFEAIQRIDDLIAQQGDESAEFAVLLVSIQDLRQINTRFGYGAGDQLLTSVAQSLSYVKREQDLLARIASSEFALLLPRVVSEGQATLAVTKILRRFDEPVSFAESSIRIDAVVGVGMWPEHGANAEALLQAADRSVRQAVLRGERWRLFSEQDQDPRDLGWTMAQELQQALQNQELELFFQPQVDLRSNLPSGAEALVRWRHPRRGLLPPAEFLPAVAESALLDAFHWWAVRNALRAASEMADAWSGCCVSVGFPLAKVLEESFVDLLAEETSFWNVPDGILQLVLTESGGTMQSKKFTEVTRELDEIGVSAVVDGFGSGCQSPSVLRRAQPQRVKIHDTLVKDVMRNERDRAIVRSLIRLAGELGVEVAAGGIEDAETLAALREWGCDFGQGPCIAPAMPREDFLAWLSAQR